MFVTKVKKRQYLLLMALFFDGHLPPKQLKMVQAWIEIHKEDLFVDWDLAVNGDELFRIAPLQ